MRVVSEQEADAVSLERDGLANVRMLLGLLAGRATAAPSTPQLEEELLARRDDLAVLEPCLGMLAERFCGEIPLMPDDEEILSRLWSRLETIAVLLGVTLPVAPPEDTERGATRLAEALLDLARAL